MVFSYKSCIEKKLLRKISPSKDKASRSINKAEEWLKEAEKTFDSEAFDSSVLAAYMVIFHSARAILFFDGYIEKKSLLCCKIFGGEICKNRKA